jgi:GNAT superfamily N-acetyltransferase
VDFLLLSRSGFIFNCFVNIKKYLSNQYKADCFCRYIYLGQQNLNDKNVTLVYSIISTAMQIVQTATLDLLQKQYLMELWNKEYPIQLGYRSIDDFEHYLQRLHTVTHYLITTREGTIRGWAFTFKREEAQWFAIIVDSRQQQQGLGSRLMRILKDENVKLKGWVVDHDQYDRPDGKPYPSPLPFYIQHGFKLIPNCRLENAQLSAVQI